MKKEVILYKNDRCIYCTQAKKWLEKNNIEFTEKDINTKEAREEYETYKVEGIPLLIVKDHEKQTENKLLGFRADSYKEALLK